MYRIVLIIVILLFSNCSTRQERIEKIVNSDLTSKYQCFDIGFIRDNHGVRSVYENRDGNSAKKDIFGNRNWDWTTKNADTIQWLNSILNEMNDYEILSFSYFDRLKDEIYIKIGTSIPYEYKSSNDSVYFTGLFYTFPNDTFDSYYLEFVDSATLKKITKHWYQYLYRVEKKWEKL